MRHQEWLWFVMEPYGAGSSSSGYCIKCSGDNKVLDPKTGKCLCKKGYGVSLYGLYYCIACPAATSYVKGGYCYCKSGYYFTSDNLQCMACKAPRYKVQKSYAPTLPPICQCGTGYEGFTNGWDNQLTGCDKCPAGQTTQTRPNNYNACICKDSRRRGLKPIAKFSSTYNCVCRWGFQEKKDGSCGYTSQCAGKKYTIQYWTGSKLPSGWDGKSFPTSLLKKAPTATATVSSLSLKPGTWPKLPAAGAKGKVAVRISRCTCVVHQTQDSQFKYSITKGTKGGAMLVIDGGVTDRQWGGDYHDQNFAMRPGVIPVIDVNGTVPAGTAKTLSLKAPQYNPRMGGWLSGFDSVPVIEKYEACHKVEVFYYSANCASSLSVSVPK